MSVPVNGHPAPVEPKVTVASVSAGVSSIVLGFLATYVFRGEVPLEISVPIAGLLTGLIGYGVGYAKTTATSVLRKRLLAQEPKRPAGDGFIAEQRDPGPLA